MSRLSTERAVTQKSKKDSVPGVKTLDREGMPNEAPLGSGIRLEESITIDKPVAEVYAFWRDFTNLPRFCKYLKEVQVLDENRSRWTVDGPAGKDLTWEAAMIDDRPTELISWQSFEGSQFENAGSVRFRQAPGNRGTEVHLTFAYNPPAGPIGSVVAKLSRKDPAFLLKEQLRRLKQLLETGEIPTTEGQPSGEAR